jgi:flagellar basal body-associated protein FliL
VLVVVGVAFVVVLMAIQFGLFEQEEEQQAAKQRGEQAVRIGPCLECLGQHLQQCRAQQHSG